MFAENAKWDRNINTKVRLATGFVEIFMDFGTFIWGRFLEKVVLKLAGEK